MNAPRSAPQNLAGLPTLTEVIDMPAPASAAVLAQAQPEELLSAAALPALSEEQIVQRVLADLQRHADLMLEYRLREALAPALARLSDSLIREVRQEFATTLRDVVARAVSQELARHRR